MKITDDLIVVEQVFESSIVEVWNAITRHEEMIQWFFKNIADFKPEVGFKTTFPVQSEERVFTHLWKVTEVDPLKKITYNWKYKEYPGDSFVTFDLFEEQNKTRLKLTTEVVENFPDEIPEFSRESCIGGWNYFINGNLISYLEQ